ncbi:hypothetical protein [Peribacillus sp. SCS-155]
MELIIHEIERLADDYKRCDNLLIKEQIYEDMKLLAEALFLSQDKLPPS